MNDEIQSSDDNFQIRFIIFIFFIKKYIYIYKKNSIFFTYNNYKNRFFFLLFIIVTELLFVYNS